MTNRVAVILRTKDRPYFLARALADVAAQTFDDAEIIVVNDGGDAARVHEVVAASSISARVSVLDTEQSQGRCAAANLGMRTATAPYVVLHDDDDYWHPEFLTRTVAELDARPDEAGVMVRTAIVVEERSGDGWAETARLPFWERITSITFSNLLEINRAVPISFLYRRAVHDEVGFYDESLETVEDWELYLRIAARYPIGFLANETLAFWTHRPAAAGADGNSMFELADQHLRDDLTVRDRALRGWVADNGIGLPLYIGLMERELRETMERRLDDNRDRIIAYIDQMHPVMSRVRRVARRIRERRA